MPPRVPGLIRKHTVSMACENHEFMRRKVMERSLTGNNVGTDAECEGRGDMAEFAHHWGTTVCGKDVMMAECTLCHHHITCWMRFAARS
jgi:hypothetical protein